MKKLNKTPLAAAMGTAVVSTFAATAVNAESNPFAMTELSDGYMQVAQSDTASEMKCGANMSKKVEGSCGEGKCGEAKCGEGKCAGNKAKTGGQQNKANANEQKRWSVKKYKAPAMAKTKDAARGEGKCGVMMDGDKMKKGMENSSGGMMKGKEGARGNMGAQAKKNDGMGMDMGGMKGGEMSCGGMMKGMQGGGMKDGDMPCGGMMQGGGMKGGNMSGGGMKGGEGSCGTKVDPDKAAGE